MNIIESLKLKMERREVEEKAIKIVNGYFRSNDIPLHAFYQKRSDSNDFASGKTDWMVIPIAPTNAIMRFGYNLGQKLIMEEGVIQSYVNNENLQKTLQKILNDNMPEWSFNRIKRGEIEQCFLVDVTKKKNA